MSAKNPNNFPNGIIDIFKTFKVLDLNMMQVKKKGEVSVEMDNEIGKKVVRISGSLSSSNFIDIPNPEYGQKSLNLSSKFYYLHFKMQDDKKFMFQFVYLINNFAVRFTFKYPLAEIKFSKSTSFIIDIPISARSNTWSILKFDPIEFIQNNFSKQFSNLGNLTTENIVLKSLQFSSHMYVRGLFLSNTIYEIKNLPKEMGFRILDQSNPYSNIELIDMTNSKLEVREVTEEMVEEKSDVMVEKQDIMEDFNSKFKIIKGKNEDLLKEEAKRKLKASTTSSKVETAKLDDQLEIDNERMIGKEHNLKEMTSELLKTKAENANKEALDKRDIIRNIFKKSDDNRVPLLPDPIMNLKYILGYSAKNSPYVRFTKNEEKKTVFFGSGNMLVQLDHQNVKQKFYFGHSRPISHFLFSHDGEVLFTAQLGDMVMIRVWRVETSRCGKIMTTPYQKLYSLSISKDNKILCTAGREKLNKELIILWDISNPFEKIVFNIVQASHFPISMIKFSPFDQETILSCGRENIKFWRVKGDHLGGKAVVLNQYARNNNFQALDFDNPFLGDNKKGRAFIGSDQGSVFQVSCITQELEAIYKVHDSPILTLALNDAFCVTGAADGVLRVWPIDFSEFLIEAKHDSGVCSVDIAYDALDIICGTLNGSIGMLNIQSKQYKTILRSPPSKVKQMILHPNNQLIFTIEEDSTIRIWDIEKKSECFQFVSSKDPPTSIDAPNSNIFACGFESGCLKIFDIENTSILYECKAFGLPISRIKYTQNGNTLITMNSQGHISIHDCQSDYMQIKLIKIDEPAINVDLSLTTEGDFFATIGPESNSVLIWNTNTYGIKNRIPISGFFVVKVCLINKNIVAIILENCTIQFYSLGNYEGTLFKEFSNIHIERINEFLFSKNFKYFFTGGEEGMIKVLDMKMLFKNFSSMQQFIGHSTGVRKLICIEQKALIISVSENDGIFFWNFLGDLTFCDSDINFELEKLAHVKEEKPKKSIHVGKLSTKQIKEDKDKVEKDEKKKKENRFNIYDNSSENKNMLVMLPVEKDNEGNYDTSKITSNVLSSTNEKQKTFEELDKKLFFTSLYTPQKYDKVAGEPSQTLHKLNKKFCVGYNNNSMSNLIYNKENNWFAFTINNKVLIEFIEENRVQIILEEHLDEISCLCISPDNKYLLSGSGSVNKEQNAPIVIWDTKTWKLVKRLNFHFKGIQRMTFSPDNKYLISIGNKDEKSVCVWNFANHTVIDSKISKFPVIDICTEKQIPTDKSLNFVTIHYEVLSFWRIDSNYMIEGFHLKFEDLLRERDRNEYLTSLELTPYIDKNRASYCLLGTNLGSLLVVDKERRLLLKKYIIIANPITVIRYTEEKLILMGETQAIVSWNIPKNDLFEMSFDFIEKEKSKILFVDNYVTSTSFVKHGNEGIVGTESGNIFYINIAESSNLKIISSHKQDMINCIGIYNDTILTGGGDGAAKIWVEDSFDQKYQFQFTDNCNELLVSPTEDIAAGIFNHTFIRFFDLKNYKNLGRVFIHQNEVNCMGYIFNNQGLIVTTLQDHVFILDVQNWDPLSILYTEIDNSFMPKNQFFSHINTKNITENRTLCLLSFSDGTSTVLEIEKVGGKIQSKVIDKFCMFEYQIAKSEDADIVELYQNLTKYRTNYITQTKFSSSFDNFYFCLHECLQFLFIRNYSTGEVFRKIALNAFPCSLSLSENEKYTAIGTKDGTILFITRLENSINSGYNLDIFKGHHDFVKDIKFSKKGDKLYSCSYNELLSWEIN